MRHWGLALLSGLALCAAGGPGTAQAGQKTQTGATQAAAVKTDPTGRNWCNYPADEAVDPEVWVAELIRTFGGKPFQNPPEVRAQDGPLPLTVEYAEQTVAGCNTRLRRYNGRLVGPTVRIRPGQQLAVTLTNALPPGTGAAMAGAMHVSHGGHGLGTTGANVLDITNFHTHGWHVDPNGISDNVLRVMEPSAEPYPVRVDLPEDHPAGSFWYHPHNHGSTAVQVSSGMAGALIVEGGLDRVPQIAAAQDQVMLFQQVQYNQQGLLESLDQLGFGTWGPSGRATLINGQVAPTLTMKSGEVQRWRMVHAGVRESLQLRLDRRADGRLDDVIPLREIAVDGLALGTMVDWPSLQLHPGYRSDVLIKAPVVGRKTTFVLYDDPIGTTYDHASMDQLDAAQAKALVTAVRARAINGEDSDARILAYVTVLPEVQEMALPTAAQLAALKAMKDILPAEATGQAQTMTFDIANAICDADGICTPCDPAKDGADCGTRFMIALNGRLQTFSDRNVLTLTLGQTARWTLNAAPGVGGHPFHIHVNPFQSTRTLPDGSEQIVWRDTLMVENTEAGMDIHTRYERYTGGFVFHCHILPHEDEGMMQLVEIVE